MSSGRVTLDEVLAACEQVGMVCEPVTASEVGEELGCTRRAALNKLDELAERGAIESKKVGARSRVWWQPPDRSSARKQADTDDALEPGSITVEGSLDDINNPLIAQLDKMFGRISDALYALDDQWQFTYVNEHAEELIDYQGEGLVGKNLWEVFEWAEDSTLGEEYRTAMATQESTSFEFYYPEPLEAWYEIHAYPSETGLSVYFRDITDRKERERELERSERRYRTLVEHFPNGAVALVDEDLHYRTVGGDPLDVADVTVEEVEGNPVGEALPPELADELAPRYETALDGEASAFEAAYDNSVFEFRVVPVRDDDGKVFAALGMSQDVTERTKSKRKLAESEYRYRALAENFPNGGVGVYDEDLRYTLVTGTMWDDIEPDAEDLEGETIRECLPPDTAEDVEPVFRAAVEDGETGTVVSTLGGRTYRVWATPLRDADGEITGGQSFALDLTDQLKREEALRESRNQLQALIDVLPVAVFVAEKDGRIVEWNEAAEEIWGGEIAEPDSVAEYDQYDGWWADTGDPVAPDEWALARALNGEAVTDPDVIEIEGFDGERRTVLNHGMPIRNADGEVTRAVVTLIDVTEREERKQRLQEQNNRLESFASMLAHELRNPVTIGQIYIQQLADDPNPEAVEYVREAFDRFEDMVDVMLILTRGRKAIGERTPVVLADAARTAWDKVEAPDAALDIDLDQTIEADETYIRHLFRNLLENAVEHGGDDVTVTVGELEDGFFVADDGLGIPEEDRDAVFDEGYTTAAGNGGTGLGLAFVRKLAEVYDWDWRVVESEDGGAQFEFTNLDPDAQ